MSSHSLFIGIVTHARSRFNVDGAAGVMANDLASRVREVGVDVDVMVSDRNDYDARTMPLHRTGLAAAAVHQAALEHRWRRYLVAGGAVGRNAVTDGAFAVAMAGKRLAESITGESAAVRLLNIDLSHLRVMAESESAGAEWTLIIEDDASAGDSAARQLTWLMSALDDTDVAFASLSESLPHQTLGISGLLRPAADIPVPNDLDMSLLRATRPVTNTVCATLYRADYLQTLRTEILHRGLTPVAPIDWRVNEAIMELHSRGALDAGSCVWVSPGIFLQRSMHEV